MGISGVNKGGQGLPLRNVNFQLTIDLRGNLITPITTGGPRPAYKETHYRPIKRVQGRFSLGINAVGTGTPRKSSDN